MRPAGRAAGRSAGRAASSVVGDAGKGLVSGVLGVIAMAGVSFTMRRLVEPTSPINPTHYEKVVASANAVLRPGAGELKRDDQVRIGELAHLGFGGFWGVLYAVARHHRTIKPLVHGLTLGTAVWALAFGGYMPKLNISRGIKDMDAYEASRTWLCHITYATATALVLDQLRQTQRSVR